MITLSFDEMFEGDPRAISTPLESVHLMPSRLDAEKLTIWLEMSCPSSLR